MSNNEIGDFILLDNQIIHSHCKLIKDDTLKIGFNPDNLDVYVLDDSSYSILNYDYPTTLHKLIYAIIKNLGINFKEAVQKVCKLSENGLIYDTNKYDSLNPEDGNFINRINNKFEAKMLYLSIAQDCNLRCKYCSAGHGRFNQSIKYMDKRIAKKSLDFLFNSDDNDKSRGIIFSGGEPLMNLDVFYYIINYGTLLAKRKGIEIYFNFNTNGTLFTKEIIEKLSQYNVYATFSIDGTKSIHDKYRVFPNGKGSYNLAIVNFKAYVKKMKETHNFFHPRVQVCLPFGKGLFESYLNLKQEGATFLVINPSWPSEYIKHHLSLNIEKIPDYLHEYEIMLEDQIKNLELSPSGPHCFMSSTMQSVSFLLEKKIRPLGCGAANNGFAINPDGNIYPCSLFLENDKYLIGNLTRKVSIDRMVEIQKEMISLSAKCETCWAKYLCGASCLAMAVANGLPNESAPTAYCDLFRGYMEKDLIFFSKLRTKGLINEENHKLSFETSKRDRFI